jgi:iron complex transport system permease protein
VKQEVSKAYTRYTTRRVIVILALLGLLLVAGIAVTPLGVASLGVGDVIQVILERLPFFDAEPSSQASIILWELRFPRIVMAIVCGMGLALSGVMVQGVFRNPLASPFTLGITSAAMFGGVLALVLGISLVGWGRYGVIGIAFLFGLGALFLIQLILRRRKIIPETMLLWGVALMYLFLALASVLTSFAGTVGASFILTGSLIQSSWDSVLIVLSFLLISLIFPLKHSWDLNAMALSEEAASSVGVNTSRVRTISLVLSTLVVASIVCFTGVIGFVCLVSPYLARLMVGSDHRFIFPCSAILGALFLLGTDTLARTLIQPIEIPVGMLTVIFGVPLFLYLVLSRRGWSEA